MYVIICYVRNINFHLHKAHGKSMRRVLRLVRIMLLRACVYKLIHNRNLNIYYCGFCTILHVVANSVHLLNIK